MHLRIVMHLLSDFERLCDEREKEESKNYKITN